MTERQKEILRQQGLPADYEQLTVKQKSAIEAIETMLVYLEQTYDAEFVYAGYVAAQGADRERLDATTTLDGQTVTVKLYRTWENGQWVYEDTYLHLVAAPDYRQRLVEFFDGKVDPQAYKIFSDVEWIEGDYEEANVLKNVAAVSVVYITEEACADPKALARDFAAWMQAQGLTTAATLQLCVVKAEDLSKVYSYNYKESISKDWVQTHIICTIDKFGGITIV